VLSGKFGSVHRFTFFWDAVCIHPSLQKTLYNLYQGNRNASRVFSLVDLCGAIIDSIFCW